MSENILIDLQKIREKRKLKRRRRLRRSILDRFRGEILVLDRNGATLSEIQEWLKNRCIYVDRTTIWHFLRKIRISHE